MDYSFNDVHDSNMITSYGQPPMIRFHEARHLRITQWNCPNLAAPFWRFYWNATDGAEVGFAEKKFRLFPDHAALISPNTPFSSHLTSPFNHFWIHFTVSPSFGKAPHGIYISPLDATAMTRIGKLASIAESGKALNSMPFLLGATAIVFELLLAIPSESLSELKIDPRIVKVKNWIDSQENPMTSNDSLANIARMSVNGFARLFRTGVGASPQLYMRSKRIDNACLLLLFGDKGIKEVAEAAGFKDRYHFTRVFKKIRGMSPGAFQRMHLLH